MPKETYTPTDRYDALKMPRPNPETMCEGKCEGTGVYPVKNASIASIVHCDDDGLPTEAELAAWQTAHDAPDAHKRKPCDGWHFITCAECGGTGNACRQPTTRL